jgi:hypothetical protein
MDLIWSGDFAAVNDRIALYIGVQKRRRRRPGESGNSPGGAASRSRRARLANLALGGKWSDAKASVDEAGSERGQPFGAEGP